MNKKTQAVLTICVDISMLAVIVAASYLLLTGRVQGWLQIAAQTAVIIAIPTIFFLTFLTFGTSRYEKLKMEDDDADDAYDMNDADNTHDVYDMNDADDAHDTHDTDDTHDVQPAPDTQKHTAPGTDSTTQT